MNDPSLVCVTTLRQRTRNAAGDQPEGSIDLIKERSFRVGSSTVRYTRIAAHLVGISAEVCRREARRLRGSGRTTESVVGTSGRADDLPENPSGIRRLLVEDEIPGASPETLARMAAAIRGADVVIAGPLTDGDASIRGLLPHLADLASNAYRVLRPSPSLIGHIGFAQVARKFQYIQMNHQDARRLAGGAIDIGVLAQVLRKRYGEDGEFAITCFGGHGLLWADHTEWEIEPIVGDNANETLAADALCTAWVVARQFQRASVPQALAMARNTAVKALAASRSPRSVRSP
jgi:hypothetical protein